MRRVLDFGFVYNDDNSKKSELRQTMTTVTTTETTPNTDDDGGTSNNNNNLNISISRALDDLFTQIRDAPYHIYVCIYVIYSIAM